jgi:phosphoribosylglycinamide formyltransferase-1
LRVAVMASGRGSNFDALLRSAREPSHAAEIVVVISDKAEAPVLAKAAAASIPTAVIDPGTRRGPWRESGIQSLLAALREHGAEAICLAGFMRIVPPEILRAFPERILNIHPALLPSFPGLHGQRQAVRAGVKIAGCTVHFVDEGVDTGPIILQAAVPVSADDTEDTLAARILAEEHRVYPEALGLLAAGRLRVEGRIVHIDEAGAPARKA